MGHGGPSNHQASHCCPMVAVSPPTNQPESQAAKQPASSARQSVSQPAAMKSPGLSASKPGNWTTSQAESKPARQTTSEPDSHSASQTASPPPSKRKHLPESQPPQPGSQPLNRAAGQQFLSHTSRFRGFPNQCREMRLACTGDLVSEIYGRGTRYFRRAARASLWKWEN